MLDVWATALQSLGRCREIEDGLLDGLVADLRASSPARNLLVELTGLTDLFPESFRRESP